MGVRRASLEARGKSAPFTRVPLPWARAGCWQAHQCSLSGWLQQGWLTVAMCPLSVGEACRRHAGASGTHPWVACSPRYAVDLDTGGPFAARRLGSEAVETSQQVTPGLCITNALRGHASPVRGLEIPSAGRTWCSPLPAAPGSPAVRVAAGRCRARRLMVCLLLLGLRPCGLRPGGAGLGGCWCACCSWVSGRTGCGRAVQG